MERDRINKNSKKNLGNWQLLLFGDLEIYELPIEMLYGGFIFF